ncbi:SAM-dependent methyltransferase [Parahaliea maris]|uniref:tRNA (guanine(46)-N(7))-methyltransferase n=1 Tax=Parahaliea maris TaxID=2716870 RepID=A0A5C8ZQS7_9GAMM|nr:SAM-dependent methyltransferase [Parahaliea maris]TXS90695.1 SAM-dependent methyltransferase [Parahaliea maris]
MQANSRAVNSSQAWTHPRLPELVRRHLAEPWRKPVAPFNREAFAALEQRLAAEPRSLVLDSFCGTGQSTALLAARYPNHLVVGVDKSAQRLQRHAGGEFDNYLLLRAECEGIWQLLLERGCTVDHHYLLYPNPWPKPGHVQRRIHGHASLPLLLQLGGRVELRSNWQLYVEEFGLAMTLAGRQGRIERVSGDPPLTLFEEKYRKSGHPLWRYRG